MLNCDNLTAFFGPEFAAPVIGGPIDNQVTIQAIFDNVFYGESESGYSKQASASPMLTCISSDIATYPTGTPVIIRGQTYKTIAKRPDGTGITEVDLHKV